MLALDTSVLVVRARTAARSQIDAVLTVVVLANDRVDAAALGDNPYALSDGALVWSLPDDSTEEGGES